ncbi:MAG: hypothetical protein H6R26_404 [Proteobacteria bacterium]|nr:hypothetical protein [Pseudomonadota bacterium]
MTEINPIQHSPPPPKIEKVKADKDKQRPSPEQKRGEKRADTPPRQHIDEYA